MAGDGEVRSLLIASEPLTVDISTWLEVPEYSMITAERASDGLEYETLDLDVIATQSTSSRGSRCSRASRRRTSP